MRKIRRLLRLNSNFYIKYALFRRLVRVLSAIYYILTEWGGEFNKYFF